jgi:hypothetical protein
VVNPYREPGVPVKTFADELRTLAEDANRKQAEAARVELERAVAGLADRLRAHAEFGSSSMTVGPDASRLGYSYSIGYGALTAQAIADEARRLGLQAEAFERNTAHASGWWVEVKW